MKKLLAILLAAMMVLALAACGNNDTSDPANGDTPGTAQNDTQDIGDTAGSSEKNEKNDSADEEIPTAGTPLNWPDNEYTKLVPTPDVGGKVLTSGEIGKLFAIELKWTMDQGIAYAKQLQDAGFGEDCVERYEKGGTLDRTANGVNVQLMDLFGITSLSIMPVEE